MFFRFLQFEFKLYQENPELASTIVMCAASSGLVGARCLFITEDLGRVNPVIAAGLSEYQWMSVAWIAGGVFLLLWNSNHLLRRSLSNAI